MTNPVSGWMLVQPPDPCSEGVGLRLWGAKGTEGKLPRDGNKRVTERKMQPL